MHVRIGGKGPAVMLLHGFGDTGDVWAPLAADVMCIGIFPESTHASLVNFFFSRSKLW